jgi:ATP-dependent Clp protease ATP-binding subunit ClpA
MFERFTTSARTAVTLAQQEARMLDRPQIGTEHVLIGLAGAGADPAAQALRSAGVTADTLRAAARRGSGDHLDADALALLGIDLDQVRRAAEERFGRGALDAATSGHARSGHIPFSAPAKKALAAAVSQAAALRTGSISSGHLLLGLVVDADGAAVRVLRSCGVDVAALSADVVALLQSEAA